MYHAEGANCCLTPRALDQPAITRQVTQRTRLSFIVQHTCPGGRHNGHAQSKYHLCSTPTYTRIGLFCCCVKGVERRYRKTVITMLAKLIITYLPHCLTYVTVNATLRVVDHLRYIKHCSILCRYQCEQYNHNLISLYTISTRIDKR